MLNEVWKCLDGIVEYGENYEVSNFGNVRRKNSIKNRKLIKDKNGYLTLTFSKNGQIKGYKVHRLVALAFISNLENKSEINHIDGNKSNNITNNLEWSTRTENINHAYKLGLKKSKIGEINTLGESNGYAKLTEKDIFDLIEHWNSGRYTQESLSKLYSVSRGCIKSILSRKTWKHLNLNITYSRNKKGGTNQCVG